MDRIAFINGDTFIYWRPIILTLAGIAASAIYAVFYLNKSRNFLAMGLSILASKMGKKRIMILLIASFV